MKRNLQTKHKRERRKKKKKEIEGWLIIEKQTGEESIGSMQRGSSRSNRADNVLSRRKIRNARRSKEPSRPSFYIHSMVGRNR
jgi:hypothetical protein